MTLPDTPPDLGPGDPADLQSLCERGQRQLMDMKYLEAEQTLSGVEARAWEARDFDTLARLYMPLQEARRQRRQRCGEGVVCLDLIAQGADDVIDGRHVVENYAQGQLLVAGWGSIAPAARVRRLQAEHGLFVETFLAAAYPLDGPAGGRAVVVVPLEETPLPEPVPRSLEALKAAVSAGCLVLPEAELPRGSRRGTPETYGQVMALWERLHAPYLAGADARGDALAKDALAKIEGYRTTLRVDYACELAHQKLSDVAKHLARVQREPAAT